MQVELLGSESLKSLPSPDRYAGIFPSSTVALVIFTLCVSRFSLDVSRTLATCPLFPGPLLPARPRPTALRLVALLSALTTVSSVLGLGGRCGSREHGSVTAGPGGRQVPFLLWGPRGTDCFLPWTPGSRCQGPRPPRHTVFWERLTAFLRFSGASEGLGLRICLE